MKKLFFLLFLAMAAAFKSNATLFVSNNTNCRVVVEIFAHDQNHGVCGLHSMRLVLEPTEIASYNNVAAINTTLGWLNGQTATTTGGTSVWGWDGAIFNGASGGGIGGVGSCFSTDNMTVLDTCIPTANVTATWTVIGSNVLLEFNP